ncbi:50S ribosomal protein L5 [Candidatus Peribacteria bacterium RIFCSPLOWO2_12_FULL_55_15]|nr:MAG: 50S ribosomal protein L5 [Candidatus Peribacteria bacterium RIFCSPHIGHO2_01_FULL_54_22]OGJ63020.1 MAG: 50S ribosomal protein L5 [Candidatus Peribacteria bacterium RIFCSPHIGHO2_02_FULL_55_24]OGJ63924.1 MAG: 50S ribosomal protein L5 [Candidatus Peribacteria bacterium RIFCSPHIGHO2_12_FULL_54_10]OGJ68624.1 MAG: 50S ribosomal protein L5 [Candidatus Peribacteria bacterium RIFCSPLOWO2_01_FULL_54_110]OGJ68845.1 MAG: 50S ribosomal protein L5 [Candidatus Peribacteria bacterium RIFCSPLOWO2_02_FULL
MAYVSLHDRLRGPIGSALQKELGIENVHELPQLEKVIVNVGINRSTMEGKEIVDHIASILGKITGQKPAFCPSRKSIANFKIRKGMIVGVMVTLRGRRMEAFIDRLVSFVFPRIRDFRGLLPRFDGRGNYAVGLSDYSVFPEVPPPPDVRQIFGMQIQIRIRAKDDLMAKALLRVIGFPFR